MLLVDACLVSSDVAGLRLTAVVADAALLSREFLAALRSVDPRLPIVAVGDAGDPAEARLVKRGVSFYPRPHRPGDLPARGVARHRRGPAGAAVAPPAGAAAALRIDGASAFLLDVSTEGLRLEVSREAGAKLGPHFQVQVPLFNVGVVVRRVWVRSESVADQPRVQCGASLIESDQRSMDAWRRMLENAPESSAPALRHRPAPVKVEPERLFGRVAQIVADDAAGGHAGPAALARPLLTRAARVRYPRSSRQIARRARAEHGQRQKYYSGPRGISLASIPHMAAAL